MKSNETTAAKLADKILLFLNCSRFEDIGVRVDPSEFSHAIPLMLTSYLSDVKYLAQAGVTPIDVGYTCNVSLINDTASDILFGNVKLLSAEEKLPLCHQYDCIDLRGSIIARYTACDVSGKTEKVKKASRNYCSWDGNAWVALSSNVQYKEIAPTYRSIEFPKTIRCNWVDPGGRFASEAAGLALGVKKLQPLMSFVSLQIPGGIAIDIPTTLRGLSGLFSLREKSFSGRRDAILHWVQSHWRQIHEDEETYVRRYLRGSREFEWFGMTCRVSVSDAAEEISSVLTEHRKRMRRDKTDRRSLLEAMRRRGLAKA